MLTLAQRAWTPSTFERSVVASLLRQFPLGASRQLARRYARMRPMRAERRAVLCCRMRLGHELLLDARAPSQYHAYLTGWFDDDLVRMAQTLLHRGDVAIDVGSNVGLWTVPLARRAARVGAHVLAFEPLRSNATRALENLALNELDGAATVVPKGLSDRPQRTDLVLREDFAAGAATGNASMKIADGGDDRYDAVPVDAVRLDDVACAADRRVSVLKIDVEGHEDHVLRGARGVLARNRPVMFVEWNMVYYLRRGVDPTAAVDAALEGLDYVTARRDPRSWTIEPRFYSPKPIDHLLLVPADRRLEVLAGLTSSPVARL